MSAEITSLTGLRGVAALTVFFSHASGHPYFSTPWQDLGRIGVALFFVLSGFLMSYTTVDCTMESVSCRKLFWQKRFARIYPNYIVTLVLLYLVQTPCLGVPCEAAERVFVFPALFLSLFLLQAWVPFKVFATYLNPPSWTLSDETFFYLCFPWLVQSLKSHPKSFLASAFLLCVLPTFLFAVCFPSNYLTAGMTDGFVDEFVLFRLGDFMCGMVAARSFQPEHRPRAPLMRVLGTVIIPLFCVGILLASPFLVPGGYQAVFGNGLLSPLFAQIVWALALYPDSWLARLLSWAPIYRFGQISYAFYLIHWSFHGFFGHQVSDEAYVVLWFFWTLAMGVCLHFFVERPAHRWLMSVKPWSCECKTPPSSPV